ncbi:hypothetical protein OIU77_009017 [Salix suchowensis]|uniref:Uncharacterized protein n=1 Tax=Salix suchowensis TaxID=1278906 RepID=A0ABQ9ACV7_9ROSI|nr:hypothetical protein OIU77_009017 [Salix suchowensis]
MRRNMILIMSKVVCGLHQYQLEGFSWLHQQAIQSLRKRRGRVEGAWLVSITAFGALQDDNLNWCHPRLNFFSKGMFFFISNPHSQAAPGSFCQKYTVLYMHVFVLATIHVQTCVFF